MGAIPDRFQDTRLSLLELDPQAQVPIVRPHRDEVKIFLRDLTRQLAREIRPATKILTLLLAIALTSLVVYFGHAFFKSYQAVRQQVQTLNDSHSKRISQHDQELADLNRRLNRTIENPPTNTKLDSSGPINDSTSAGTVLPSTLRTSYGDGICLVAGSYILTEPGTSRPLRHPEVGPSFEERLLTTGTQLPLTYEGNGTVFEMEFEGTGFYVGDGFLITNRHIAADPWTGDERGQFFISSSGSKPRVHKLLAFCPGLIKPTALSLKATSPGEDIAVCKFENRTLTKDIPILPLDQESKDVVIGKPVVMMGFPTGPHRLLALLPEQESLGMLEQYGASLPLLLDQLAKRKLIRPLTTQGHITDLYKNRIVFDAATNEGSSGSPMFGESGKVIGISFAIIINDGASNVAVSIHGAIEQLRIAGWKVQ